MHIFRLYDQSEKRRKSALSILDHDQTSLDHFALRQKLLDAFNMTPTE